MVTFMIDFAMFPYTKNTTLHSKDCSLIATRFILPVKFGRITSGFILLVQPKFYWRLTKGFTSPLKLL